MKGFTRNITVNRPGANLVYNNKALKYTGNTSKTRYYWRSASGGTGTRSVVTISTPPIKGVTQALYIKRAGNSCDMSQDKIPVTKGKAYCFSCWIRCTTAESGTAGLSIFDQKNSQTLAYLMTTVTSQWTRLYVTATMTSSLVGVYVKSNTDKQGCQFCGMKFELGDHPTPFKYNATYP